jgi:hypothetical protein
MTNLDPQQLAAGSAGIRAMMKDAVARGGEGPDDKGLDAQQRAFGSAGQRAALIELLNP